jgi:predicted acyl esterase
MAAAAAAGPAAAVRPSPEDSERGFANSLETTGAGHRRELRQLNLALVATAGIVVLFLILAGVWSASGWAANFSSSENDEWWQIPLHQRASRLDLNFTADRSQLPEAGPYEVLPYTEHFVAVDLPLAERDAGYPDDPVMHLALWMPAVPEGTLVPVIATIHPYYDFGSPDDKTTPNTEPDRGVGAWVLEQFVPYGYALAQVSTFGTGKSTHCQDVKGRGEQIGIDAVVTWLGSQEWSNGKVGIMGKSYAGTTTWEAAQFENEYLATIVPISGSIGVQQMFYRNGSSESRAMVYDLLYEGATVDGDTDDIRICSDDLLGPASPFTTYAAAELGGDRWNDYWEERYHLPDVLQNYNGSVYLVWGLQDWNVDPYHAFPTYQMLIDAGIDARAFIGQWGHNYPDQPDRHASLSSGYGAEAYPNMTRFDWAIELYNWFNWYLKGEGQKPENQVQIQTNDGRWHVEATWPPADMEWEIMTLDSFEAQGNWVSATNSITLESQPLQQELHISGLPTLHLSVRPGTCNGGQIFATLYDGTDDLRLGHAVMDLRYRDGGYEAKPVLPYNDYLMQMEFNPLDVVLPAGHTLRIELTESGEDYLPAPCALVGMAVEVDSASALGLPLITRTVAAGAWFDVPQPKSTPA